MTTDDKYSNEMSNPDVERILSEMNGMAVPQSSRSKEDIWSSIMQSVVEQEGQPKVVAMGIRRTWLAVAASVIVLLAASWGYVWFSTVEKVTPKGLIADLVLPDGSVVTMNADSRVEYPKFFNLVGRKVRMSGEAFFNVKPGDRFTVIDTKGRSIDVVGTEFNVNSRENIFQVICFSGSVNVKAPSSNPVKLTKGLRVDLDKDQFRVIEIPVDSASSPTWITGEFFFDSAALSDVLNEIERQFNVIIKVDGFNPTERTYTGFFRNRSLREALDLVTLPMGLSYAISADSTNIVLGN